MKVFLAEYWDDYFGTGAYIAKGIYSTYDKAKEALDSDGYPENYQEITEWEVL